MKNGRKNLCRGVSDAALRQRIAETALAIWQEFLTARRQQCRVNRAQVVDLLTDLETEEGVAAALPEFAAADPHAQIRMLLETGGCILEEARRREATAMSVWG